MTTIFRNFSPIYPDDRGALGIVDFPELPFMPVRLFWVSATSPSIVRADHAHLRCSQFLICARGHVEFQTITQSADSDSGSLDPGDAFLLEPKTWLRLHDFTVDALVLVFCDLPYDREEYITDFTAFTTSIR